MLKKIFGFIKKIVLAGFILYGYNALAVPINIMIPINYINLGLITIFGFPALFSLIIINIVIF